MLASLDFAAKAWFMPAAIIVLVGLAIVAFGYGQLKSGSRVFPALLKASGLALLVFCLLDPQWISERAKPGANQFVVLVDNSRSLTVKDQGKDVTRGDEIAAIVKQESIDPNAWQVRLQQDFDVRRYTVGSRLTRVADYEQLEFDGTGTSLNTALQSIAKRYANRSLAGVLVVSDGNVTDLQDGRIRTTNLPPVYPVVVGSSSGLKDLRIDNVAVRETPFEDAPVTITASAQAVTSGHGTVTAELISESGDNVAKESQAAAGDDENSFAFWFQVRPTKTGVEFYRLQATGDDKADQDEATFDNNEQLICVNRDHRRRRVLYISGRPNWEFKFLNRALMGDDQLDVVGLVRVAKREAKFDFRGRAGESSNSIFRGFKEEGDEETEEYDQPVIVRVNTRDDLELRDGFPTSPEELFAYDAVILDDIEARFFTADQQDLLDSYVSQRGGGLLMLGGQEMFRAGGYDRTPIGRMLPVYLDRPQDVPGDASFRMNLTREGRLQPWMRLRKEWDAEKKRLADLPNFRTVNRIASIKPGAMVMASVNIGETQIPAVITQTFGKGKTAAITIGDLWRWRLREDNPVTTESQTDDSDQAKAWRQILRWLVVDVPQRVNADVEAVPQIAPSAVKVSVRVRDDKFESVENAVVRVQVATPEGTTAELEAEAGNEPGLYEVVYVPRSSGGYRATVVTTGPDGEDLGIVNTGWASDPAKQEFASVAPNFDLMRELATQTGGEVIDSKELDAFAASLPNRKVKETILEPWSLWNQSWFFLIAIGCLVGEWGVRRWKGLP